jgi:hypothetical protein
MSAARKNIRKSLKNHNIFKFIFYFEGMPKADDYVDDEIDLDGDEPIPAKRDIKIFQIKKEKEEKEDKDEDFEEDVFV